MRAAASLPFMRIPLLLLGAAGLALAGPYPRDSLHDFGYSFLMPRGCDSYCGADNQLCCQSGQSCATLDGDIATCTGGSGGGSYGDYTTTWTVTYTSTHFTHYAPAPQPTAGVACIPKASDQQACGTICCAGWQTCAFQGQCSAKPGAVEPSTVLVTSNGQVTTQYSAPYRVTGTTVIVTSGTRPTETGSSTSSAPQSTGTNAGDQIGGVTGDSGGGGGLSGGAIAGIVIGSLAGVGLLILLCFCCIVRGIWGLIFGRKDKHRDERTEVIEERYSHHGGRVPSAYSRKQRHGGWFGGGGGPSSAGSRREKKKHSGGFWLAVAGGAATLLALLNLKKDKKPQRKAATSRYSDSYYTYSDATSPSSASSGGRTRDSRRSRDPRRSRSRAESYYSRGPRR